MDSLRVYHASPVWFERPDADHARRGDGRSVHGLGFNVTPDLGYARAHLERRTGSRGAASDPGATGGGVVFALDLRVDSVLDARSALDPVWAEAVAGRAEAWGLAALGGDLRRLGRAAARGDAFEWRGYYANGASRTLDAGDIKAEDALDMIRHSLPDQRLENEFLLSAGVKAVKTGDVAVLIDHEAIPPLRVHEIVGLGPRGMPPDAAPGSPAARPRRIRFEEQAHLWSERLTRARDGVEDSGDERLASAFRKLAKALVSDEYIADPAAGFKTARQSAGFDLRDAAGGALLGALACARRGGAGREEVAEAFDRLAAASDDPGLRDLARGLGREARAHVDRAAAAARAARSLVAGDAPARPPHVPLPDAPLPDAFMARLAAGAAPGVFAHAHAAVQAAGLIDHASPPARASAGARERVAALLREACAPGGAARAAAAALPLAAEWGRRLRDERGMPEAIHEVVCSVRAFAAALGNRGLRLEADPALAPPRSAVAVPARALAAALGGRFAMPEGFEILVEDHPGWTVCQRAGTQIIKREGRLENFVGEGGALAVPAVVARDGSAVDVHYDGEGRQIRARSPRGPRDPGESPRASGARGNDPAAARTP